MDRRGFLLGCLGVSACATLPPPVLAPRPAAVLPELEPLYGVVPGPEGLTIRVASHGCTARQSLVFYVDRRGGTARLAFARRRIDQCKPVAEAPVAIVFTWRELGVRRGERVVVLNPLA